MLTPFRSSESNERLICRGRPLVVVLALSDFSKDPRVMRQLLWLKDHFDVVGAGFSPPQDGGIRFINISPKGDAGDQLAEVVHEGDAGNQLNNVGQEGDGGARRSSSAYWRLRVSVANVPGARYIWRKLRNFFAIADCPSQSRGDAVQETGDAVQETGDAVQETGDAVQETGDAVQETGDAVQETYVEYYKTKLAANADWSLLESLSPDLIIANDLDCLVLSNLIFRQAKIVFDAHEYAPLEYNYQADWWSKYEQPARVWACQTFLPHVAGMSTVCRGIAAEFEKNFDIPWGIEIVTNAPLAENLLPRPTGKIIRIVHHGLGAPLRKIELMAEAVKLLGFGYELNLVLVEGDPEYIQELRSKYEAFENIHFLDPVPMPEIARFISSFDIGIFILEPEIFNYEWALPNKFFEFIQARLAIAVGPSPEMGRIVQEFGLGIVAADFSPEAMAKALLTVSPLDIDRYKANSDRCARIFCAEANKGVMLEMISRALKRDLSEGVA